MVDLDRMFAAGFRSDVRFHDVFVDRDALRARFADHVRDVAARRWPPDELIDPTRPALNVLAIIGDGGIGKSSLLRVMAREVADAQRQRTAVAVVDFADVANLTFEHSLLRIRSALGAVVGRCVAFDIALAIYWERKHPGRPLTTFTDHSSRLQDTFRSVDLGQQVGDTLDELLGGGMGGVSVLIRLGRELASKSKQSVHLRRIASEFAPFEAIIAEEDPDAMLGWIGALLGYDVERWRDEHGGQAICVLDTFENVQQFPMERGGLEDLMTRLIMLVPNIAFAIGSRRDLTWHEQRSAALLTYGGPERWPTLRDVDAYPGGAVAVQALDRVHAEEYLLRVLTLGSSPAIPEDIRERIIEGAHGSPHYLELSAEHYHQLVAQRRDLAVEEFGGTFPEVALRVMRDLSKDERDLLRAASLVQAFDATVLAAMVPRVRGRVTQAFLRRSFVEKHGDAWPSYRLHENLRRAVNDGDDVTDDGWTPAERDTVLGRAVATFSEIVLSVWDDGPQDDPRVLPAFLLTWKVSATHGLEFDELAPMAYTIREMGHWNALDRLPDVAGPKAPTSLINLGHLSRLAVSDDANAEGRYESIRELLPGLPDAQHRAYAEYEMGNLAFLTGDLARAHDHFERIDPSLPGLGTGAVFGTAGVAMRRSHFRRVAELMATVGKGTLDRARVADMLGHAELHNGRFDVAVTRFQEALELAHQRGAPLWVGRALRHLLLALMWCRPGEIGDDLMQEAREINATIDRGAGIAQCDMADAMRAAASGDWERACELLNDARRLRRAMGARFELLPHQSLDVLFDAARGDDDGAFINAQALERAHATGRAVGPTVWVAVTRWWTGQDHDEAIDWLEPASARTRWMRPLEMLRDAT